MKLRRTLRQFLFFSLAGLSISVYLSWVYLTEEAPFCLGGGGCTVVQSSPYAQIAGVPMPVLGTLLYIGMTLLVVLALSSRRQENMGLLLSLLFGTALAGLLFSAYLIVLELFVIYAICLWCSLSALAVLVAFVLSVRALRQFEGR